MAIRVARRPGRSGALVLLLISSLLPDGLVAQQVIVPIELSFSDPGARSMGFGGAFLALADDATAAFANPAGLVQLIRPEISVEGRHWSYSTPYTVGGRLEGEPSGVGLDNTDGLRSANSGHNTTNLSFLSLAYPSDGWTLAFYRHRLSDYEFSGETQGFFEGGTDCCQIRREDQRVSADLDLVSYGLSAGIRLADPLSIGIGLVYFDSSIDTEASEYLPDDDSLESIFGPNSYLPDRLIVTETSDADDSDWGLTGGFLWQLSPSWTLGGVYREAPEIRTDGEVIVGSAIDIGVPPGEVIFRESDDVEFPDVYGLGLAYRAPDGRLTLSFQWNRVEYSNVVDSLDLDDQTVDDADEWHVGGEYVFLGSTPIIAARLGLWWEPDHQLRATPDADPITQALLPRGDDEMHYAGGLGIALENFQIDVGVDFSDRVDTLSLSAIYSF